MTEKGEILAAVAPTEADARKAAARIARRRGLRLDAYSLDRYLRSPRAPSRIVVCPAGRSLESDVAFLREVSLRALWPPPGEILAGAIEGLLGIESRAASAPRRRSTRRETDRDAATAIFLEGTVTSSRARTLARGAVRVWVVEDPRRVRAGARLLEELAGLGVRWFALQPVTIAAVCATPALDRSRSRWKGLLPTGTRVWVVSSP